MDTCLSWEEARQERDGAGGAEGAEDLLRGLHHLVQERHTRQPLGQEGPLQTAGARGVPSPLFPWGTTAVWLLTGAVREASMLREKVNLEDLEGEEGNHHLQVPRREGRR